MDFSFDLMQVFSAFVILFLLIDPFGSLPIFLSLQAEGKDIHPLRSTLSAFIIMLVFMFVGEGFLGLFDINVSSFAIAGGVIIFVIALEMTFGAALFKDQTPGGSSTSTFVPIVFPLLAGPATFTALLTMRVNYTILDIVFGLLLNMIIVYGVLKNLGRIEKIIGFGGVYVARKFFGVILMAIAVKIVTENIMILIGEAQ